MSCITKSLLTLVTVGTVVKVFTVVTVGTKGKVIIVITFFLDFMFFNSLFYHYKLSIMFDNHLLSN